MERVRMTYILRIWRDATLVTQKSDLACSLQLPTTEETHYFPSLEAALEFIRQRAEAPRQRE